MRRFLWPLVAFALLVVVLAVLPVTVVLVVQLEPLTLVWIVKSRVFQALSSPPAPACLTTNRFSGAEAPR